MFVDGTGYTALQVAEVAAKMAEHRVSWLEEPVSSDDLVGLASLRAQLEPDIAAGECSWTLEDSPALMNAAAVGWLQLDVTRCGRIGGI